MAFRISFSLEANRRHFPDHRSILSYYISHPFDMDYITLSKRLHGERGGGMVLSTDHCNRAYGGDLQHTLLHGCPDDGAIDTWVLPGFEKKIY